MVFNVDGGACPSFILISNELFIYLFILMVSEEVDKHHPSTPTMATVMIRSPKNTMVKRSHQQNTDVDDYAL